MIPVILYGAIAARRDDVTRIDAPGNIVVEVDNLNFSVSFDEVLGAISYRWRIAGDSDWTDIGADTFFDSFAAAGEYTVQIQGIESGGVHGKTGTSDVFELADVSGTLAAAYLTLQFPAGADVAQSGTSDYLRLYLPDGTSHVWWAHAGTSTQPSLSGSPTYHQIDVGSLEADAVTALFAQAIVNAGSPTPLWTISGYTQQTVPVNTVAPAFSTTTLTIGGIAAGTPGTYTQSPTSHNYQFKVNGSNSGSIVHAFSFDTAGLSDGDVLSVNETATNAIGTSSPVVTSSNSVTVALPEFSGTPFISGSPSSSTRNDFDGWVGCRVTVGAVDIILSALGRWIVSGSADAHTVRIRRVSNLDLIAEVSIDAAAASPGEFGYATASGTLLAGEQYWIVSEESNGGDLWYNTYAATITAVAGIEHAFGASDLVLSPGTSGNCFVPVNFLYSSP